MSVHGEFQRILADCLAVLREAEGPKVERRMAALELAARDARNDLTGVARRVLRLCGEAPPDLATEPRERYSQRTEHLADLCRAILGERP